MRMLTDNPISNPDEDSFGFDVYASLLANSILETPDLPFCLGVFGAWGTGKTSLMRMIRAKLEEDRLTKTVWFNPWKYDRQKDLWSAVIQSILYSIGQSNDQTVAHKAKELAASTAWILFKKLAATGTSGFLSSKDLEKMKKVFLKDDELYHRHLNQFEADFEKVVQMYAGGGRLVVFVDDMDRCLPGNAVTVLESLKLFVGSARCVFVLAMDPVAVEQGIISRYGSTLKMSGRDYLDKMIQIPFFLPPVPFHRLREALSVAKTVDYDDRIWRLLELGLGGNPGQTKRFVNCFFLLSQIISSARMRPDIYDIDQIRNETVNLSPDIEQFYLAKLMVFQLSFDRFYSYLAHKPEAWSLYDRIAANGPDSESFEANTDIREFWEDLRLRAFMSKTSSSSLREIGIHFPPSPSPRVVTLLMKAISLVGRPDSINDQTYSSSSSSSSSSS